MKIYDYTCAACGRTEERFTLNKPPKELMCRCGGPMRRQFPAPYGKVKGRADGNDRNDADQFTADMIGVPVKDLPSGLRANDKDRAK